MLPWRSSSLPRHIACGVTSPRRKWLAKLGYCRGVRGDACDPLDLFFPGGEMAPGGAGPGIVGALPAAAWLIATGIVLIQNRRGSAAASTSARAS